MIRVYLRLAILGILAFAPMLAEAALSWRNERALRDAGALEPRDDVYPAMQVIYPGGFAAMYPVLRRLEEKAYVSHEVDGRTYVYHPTQPRGRVAAKAVQRIVDWFCNGSVEEVLVGMVDTAMLDQRQLRMLADKIAEAKRGKK